jgi:pimeloyl-ACP methyl ester carboxylesterase
MTYRWGTGERVILLVHGWRSRASRFAAIIRALESPDVTIIAFDAPGNGDSPGRFVTILDYADIIAELSDAYGPIDTVVGHSFGVLSEFYAVHEGVAVNRIVAISGMYGADQLVEKFSDQAGLPPRVQRGLRRRIERRTFPTIRNPWRRFVAEIDPAHSHVPLLVIHDADDAAVDSGQAVLIAEAHPGAVQSLITTGLGHSRILSDPEVVATIAEFVAGSRLRSTTGLTGGAEPTRS